MVVAEELARQIVERHDEHGCDGWLTTENVAVLIAKSMQEWTTNRITELEAETMRLSVRKCPDCGTVTISLELEHLEESLRALVSINNNAARPTCDEVCAVIEVCKMKGWIELLFVSDTFAAVHKLFAEKQKTLTPKEKSNDN